MGTGGQISQILQTKIRLLFILHGNHCYLRYLSSSSRFFRRRDYLQCNEEAKTQIGNISKQATADLNKRALENAKDSKKYKTADTITKIGGGIAGGAAALGGGLALGGVTLPAAAIVNTVPIGKAFSTIIFLLSE